MPKTLNLGTGGVDRLAGKMNYELLIYIMEQRSKTALYSIID